MKTVVYPGSFDPVTNGHLDIIHRASAIFDELVVLVADNPNKKSFFSMKERTHFLEELIGDIRNVSIDSFDGLLVDYVAKTNVDALVRGLRAVSDFEMEFQMALINKRLHRGVETVFLVTSTEYSFLSSSIIKEVASFNGDVSNLVPPIVAEGLKKKFAERDY